MLIDRFKTGAPFFMDGAMGTSLQKLDIGPEVWKEYDGCNEWLNLAIPDSIRDIHSQFFKAGSDAVETNTFGASPLTLGEYQLESRAVEINRAAARLARDAADEFSTDVQPRYVIGSIGPGTRLPSLGQVSFDDLCDGYQVQLEGLLEGGVDGILLETCQDLLQIKAGLTAIAKSLGTKHKYPIYVSVTVETTGTLLIGSSIGAVVAALIPYPVDVLGLNCATGPRAMHHHLDYLKENWSRMIGCMPNAGLPEMTPEGTVYPLQPVEFSESVNEIARDVGIQVFGGCCGTTPEHIRVLRDAIGDWMPERNGVKEPEQLTSVFSPVDLSQDPAPLYIGERANATGSKKFREALLNDDYDTAFEILTAQEDEGAHAVDLSCAYAGRDEARDMLIMMSRVAKECRMPVVIDSTQADIVESCLKLYGGRAIINSINFEDGDRRAHQVAALARQYGAALVGLTIDEEGMAMTCERKVAVAKRLVQFCNDEYGISASSILIDPLTFTIGSGDDSLRTAAMETLHAIREIKRELPGVRTLLGLSNISFGLKPAARKVLNALFLDYAIKHGMDSCIINLAHILPLNQIDKDALSLADRLIKNQHENGDPLFAFIDYFENTVQEEDADELMQKPPEEVLTNAVIKGKVAVLQEAIPVLLENTKAEDILNGILVPAMKEVGRLFNDGIMQLPFVLKSAEVMKKSVDMIKPYMEVDDSSEGRGTMVIATVAGDVHDIGKNLVDIILSNNGFNVVNLGTKVPVEVMIESIKEQHADVLGMSGLLVKSAAIMAENLKIMKETGIQIPVFLGGAALTQPYVAEGCQPHYEGPVVYCRDAFAGLSNMRKLSEEGFLPRAEIEERPQIAIVEPEIVVQEIDLSEDPPQVPFKGYKTSEDILLDDIYPLINEVALIRGRWGFKRGKLSREAFDAILKEEAMPKLEYFKERGKELFKPAAAYGYFECKADGEALFIEDAERQKTIEMTFPRQGKAPFWSIPDFFRRDADIVGMMVVTLGEAVDQECNRLKENDEYQDYVLLHGFAVEACDALAELWHKKMRAEMGHPDPEDMSLQDYIVQRYQSSRYGFGYPSVPDMRLNDDCCRLVHAEEIGVSLSESYMMIPEVTTSALVAHHPVAKYFNV